MTDTGRTIYAGGGGSDGLAFDNAAGAALVSLNTPGKVALGTSLWDHADWDNYAGVTVDDDSAVFGDFDVANDDATFYFTQAGLYLFETQVTFDNGSGLRTDRFVRIKATNSYCTPFTPAPQVVGGQSTVKIAAVLPATEGAAAKVEFFSDGSGDEVTGVTFQVRRLLAGAWE